MADDIDDQEKALAGADVFFGVLAVQAAVDQVEVRVVSGGEQFAGAAPAAGVGIGRVAGGVAEQPGGEGAGGEFLADPLGAVEEVGVVRGVRRPGRGGRSRVLDPDVGRR